MKTRERQPKDCQHRQYGWPKHTTVISADVKRETKKGHYNVLAFASTTGQSMYYE